MVETARTKRFGTYRKMQHLTNANEKVPDDIVEIERKFFGWLAIEMNLILRLCYHLNNKSLKAVLRLD